jgi:hypothetical protein
VKSLLWFLVGVAGGFVVAHLMNKDPRGHEILAEVDARIGEFTEAVGDAYREQEARISELAGDLRGAASDALDAAKDTAGDVAGVVKDAAAEAVDTAKGAASDAADSAKKAASSAAKAAKKLTD